ncbi:MAG TPA: tetratricopeptide repeat protein [Gammaproteobacteria bacterium]
MDAHEQEQIEGIKAWWRENRWYILGGLVISAVAVGGWRMWLQQQQELAEAASLKYENVITQSNLADLDALESSIEELQAEYSDTPYASLGTLKLAAAQVDADDFAAAADSLRWVVENTDDPQLALVARLRLARVLLQQGDFAAVHKALDVADAGEFTALYEELRGDAFLAVNDRDNARKSYEAALAAMDSAAPGDRSLVQMKLDNLAMPIDSLLANTEPAAPVESEAAVPPEDGSVEAPADDADDAQ